VSLNAAVGFSKVTLPKFKLEDTLQLHEVLPSLGVVDVFDPTKSDLSAIAAGERLSIDQVLHKAVLEVRLKMYSISRVDLFSIKVVIIYTTS